MTLKATLPVIGLLLIVGTYVNFVHPRAVPFQWKNRFNLEAVEGWRFDGREDDPSLRDALDADIAVRFAFGNTDGERLTLRIAYFATQEQGREIVGEKTEKLFADYTVIDEFLEDVGLDSVFLVKGKDGSDETTTVFWYDIGGNFTTSKYAAKLRNTFDYLTRLRNNAALVAVELKSSRAERLKLPAIRDFLKDVLR